jgi:serine phosphatase RsbU (regulator of sigma subunit)
VIAAGRADIRTPGGDGRFASVLVAPLPGRAATLGAVVLGRTDARPPFTAGDEKLVVALADQAAVALERAWLHRADAERQRMEQELVVARRIQLGLLPRALPQPPGWSIAGLYEAAREVGGDIYDAFPLPDSTSHLSLLVADVTGKGVPAALVMASARAILRAEACAGRRPSDVLKATNRALLVGQPSPLFLSALHAVLDVDSGRLRYASAGHEPLVLVRASGEARLLESAGVVIGAFERIDIAESSVDLAPGDLVALYTDGVTEARDESGRMFGEERLVDVLTETRGQSAPRVVERVQAALAAFTGDTPQFDDVTLLVVARDPG